jgi:hypothetical protein
VNELEKGVEGATVGSASEIGATVGSAADSAAVKADFSQVPLPQEGAEGERVEANGQALSSPTQAEVAILEFENPAGMVEEVPLSHPFRWRGEWLRKVSVRRLTFAEALRVNDEAQTADREVKSIDLFAAMTGLSAPVIRGMEATDADRVTKACLPFLPLVEEGQASP